MPAGSPARPTKVAPSQSVVAGAAILIAVACAHNSPAALLTTPAPVAVVTATCTPPAPPLVAQDSLVVVVTDSVDPRHAPVALTAAEHFVFSQLYYRTDACAPHGDTSAVARGSSWPPGNGTYEVSGDDGRILHLSPRDGPRQPSLVVSRIRPSAARDALEQGADVVVTDDAPTIGYAMSRSDLEAIPLPWDRVYTLISSIDTSAASIWDDSAFALRAGLARDAVRADAGIASPAISPIRETQCDRSRSDSAARESSSSARAIPRILYPADDSVARAASARIVALARKHDPQLAALAPALNAIRGLRAEGAPMGDIVTREAAGLDAAYLVTMPIGPSTSCAGAPPRMVPLIATRSRLIVNRERLGATVDSTGDVRLVAPSRGRP